MKEEKLSDGPLLQGVSKYEEVLDSTRRFREAIIAQGRPYTLALTCRVDRSQSIFDDVHVIPRSFEGFASELTYALKVLNQVAEEEEKNEKEEEGGEEEEEEEEEEEKEESFHDESSNRTISRFER
uniref:Uncharacterized protein n=1 Tax=Vespula pensylvanica TaxID=30213 RepID=A0A834UAW3_VESPE|nr:hypothetical protein H0235_007005 [Vespula pensylvanica]